MSNSKGDGGGLFSKVVKFVRSPASSWAEAQSTAEATESGYSRQMLKEMIERKRRNDFVRKREFDMLRKLRRNEAIAGNDLAARPSFFQSSMPSRPDDRASTLKKIDEIEAQMSQQWWKTRNPEGVRSTFVSPSNPLPIDPTLRPSGPGGMGSMGDAVAPPGGPTRERQTGSEPTDLGFIFSLSSKGNEDEVFPSIEIPPAPPGPAPAGPLLAADPAEPASPLPRLEGEEFQADGELEDAAIRFASGDDDGAERALTTLVGPGGLRHAHEGTWLALFDFYRAAGRQERFDEAAVEFASRFGRSAPQWVNLAQVASDTVCIATDPTQPQSAHWNCPPTLGVQALGLLQATVARTAAPWRLGWSRLVTIDEAALEPLTRLFTTWAAQPVQIHFIDAEHLDHILRQRTASGDRGVNAAWWRLRMEALRIMHRPDEFEIVALDYCVTYEVSPPSWESPRGKFRALQPDGTDTGPASLMAQSAFRDSFAAHSLLSADAGRALAAHAELVGLLQGDAAAALERLDARMGEAEVLLISCARLVRVDFSASGSLLNWVAARIAEGRQVQFTDVHRLVASFFAVVGIASTVRLTVRRD